MALNDGKLKSDIIDIMEVMENCGDCSKDETREIYANAFVAAIKAYVKSGTVSTNIATSVCAIAVSGSAGTNPAPIPASGNIS